MSEKGRESSHNGSPDKTDNGDAQQQPLLNATPSPPGTTLPPKSNSDALRKAAAAAAADTTTTPSSTATTATSSTTSLPPPAPFRAALRWVVALAAPELPSLAVSAALLGLYSRTTLQIPRSLGTLLDMSGTGTTGDIKKQCWSLTGLFCVGGAANFARLYLGNRASERITLGVRARLFASLLRQDMAFHDEEQHTSSRLVHRLHHDADRVGKMITDTFLQGCKSAAQTVGSLYVIFKASPKLAACMVCLLPPAAVSAACYGRFAKSVEARAAERLATNSATAEAFLANVRVVKAFSEEAEAERLYGEGLDDTYRVRSSGILASASYTAFLQTSGYMVLLALMGVGTSEVAEGRLTLGQLTSLMMYTMFGGLGIMGCGNVVADTSRTVALARTLRSLMPPPAAEASGAAAPAAAVRSASCEIVETHMLPADSVGGEIKMEGVQFAYPSRPNNAVWRDVSFVIPSGSCCAVVGHSGAGKTTLANLLLKLYEPTAGSITLEGVDVAEIPTAQLRELISYVPQDPLLFAGTVASNILFGVTLPPGMDRVQLATMAAKQAHAHDFIAKLSNGYDTYVGDKGSQLSGGQRQRIAIARALAREICGQSRILILDEATSGLDPVNKVCEGCKGEVQESHLETHTHTHVHTASSAGHNPQHPLLSARKQRRGTCMEP